jgi:predicted ATPase with chaperone activity
VVRRYQKRISGPLMDRCDIHIEVPRVDYDKLTSDRLGEPTEQVRARVEAARAVQQELLVDAALSGNRQIALQGLLLDAQIVSLGVAHSILAESLATTAERLPCFHIALPPTPSHRPSEHTPAD